MKVTRFLTCFSNASTLIINSGSNLVVASLNVTLSYGIGTSESSLARSSTSKNSVPWPIVPSKGAEEASKESFAMPVSPCSYGVLSGVGTRLGLSDLFSNLSTDVALFLPFRIASLLVFSLAFSLPLIIDTNIACSPPYIA